MEGLSGVERGSTRAGIVEGWEYGNRKAGFFSAHQTKAGVAATYAGGCGAGRRVDDCGGGCGGWAVRSRRIRAGRVKERGKERVRKP